MHRPAALGYARMIIEIDEGGLTSAWLEAFDGSVVDGLDVEALVLDHMVARPYHSGHRSFPSSLEVECSDRPNATTAY